MEDDLRAPPAGRFIFSFNDPLTTLLRRHRRTSQRLKHHCTKGAARSPLSQASKSNFYTSTLFLQWERAGRALGKILILALVCIAAGALALLRHQNNKEQAPVSNLRAFALSEMVKNDLEGVDELTVDGLKLYAQAKCVHGESAEKVRDVLLSQLSNIPHTAREELISSAVVNGMSTTSTRQDTATDVAHQGTAFSYLAFWSTVYNGEHTLMAAKYSTCIMAAGVVLKIGEDLAGFETSSRSVQIGTKPCHCGVLICEACPDYKTVVTKKPLFKRHRITLKQQVDLHRRMVKQAVARAENLVQTRGSLSGRWGKQKKGKDNPMTIGWEKPSSNQFLGEDMATMAGGSDESISAESFEITKR